MVCGNKPADAKASCLSATVPLMSGIASSGNAGTRGAMISIAPNRASDGIHFLVKPGINPPGAVEATMEISQEVLRNCAGLGMVACRLPSMKETTLEIFEAVKAASPANPAWLIGMGMVYANAGDSPEAACAFMMKQRISAETGDPLARAYLGLFLVMANRRTEAARVAKAVVAGGDDPDAVRLAQSLLDNEIGNG